MTRDLEPRVGMMQSIVLKMCEIIYTLPSQLPRITHRIYIAMKFSFTFSHFYSIVTDLQNLSTFIITILR